MRSEGSSGGERRGRSKRARVRRAIANRAARQKAAREEKKGKKRCMVGSVFHGKR